MKKLFLLLLPFTAFGQSSLTYVPLGGSGGTNIYISNTYITTNYYSGITNGQNGVALSGVELTNAVLKGDIQFYQDGTNIFLTANWDNPGYVQTFGQWEMEKVVATNFVGNGSGLTNLLLVSTNIANGSALGPSTLDFWSGTNAYHVQAAINGEGDFIVKSFAENGFGAKADGSVYLQNQNGSITLNADGSATQINGGFTSDSFTGLNFIGNGSGLTNLNAANVTGIFASITNSGDLGVAGDYLAPAASSDIRVGGNIVVNTNNVTLTAGGVAAGTNGSAYWQLNGSGQIRSSGNAAFQNGVTLGQRQAADGFTGGDLYFSGAGGTSLSAFDGVAVVTPLTVRSNAVIAVSNLIAQAQIRSAGNAFFTNTITASNVVATAGFVIASNDVANWPSAPPSPGASLILSSNGFPFLLLSTGSAWTQTNKLGW